MSRIASVAKARGTGYGRKPSTYESLIAEAAPGTPCGELMRRYWHPVELSERVASVPREVRILGEDLIVFRDRKDRVGLLHARCAHRGTTLYYGKVEDEGIRCCYHGWLFSVDGQCLDQPCEPEGGAHRDRIRQPWYEVQERYGIVWAYMGPPERKPLLPRYSTLEGLDPNEKLFATGQASAPGGDDTIEIVPCNWLQDWENIMDPFHIPILHTSFSGVQFVPEMGVMPTVTFEHTDHGMQYTAFREFPDGRKMNRVTQALLPYVRIVPDTRLMPGEAKAVGFVVPVDDTHFRLFHISRVAKEANLQHRGIYDGRKWSELSAEEHQRIPGGLGGAGRSGPISFHSEENLVSSDRGVGRLRAFLRQQIKAVEQGDDPLGVVFMPEDELYHVRAGNFFL